MKRLTLFWSSALGALWVLIGYPLSLLLAPRREWQSAPLEPSLSVIIPAYHEREALVEKLLHFAQLDYPAQALEVIVVSDGDAELGALASAALPSARVIVLAQRSGKAAALNAGLAVASGEIIVLTNAHGVFDPQILRASTCHFNDPDIGAVTGHWAERGSVYDRYEDLLRRLETRSGSVASMFGAFIAVRRAHLERFPDGVINDDLWLLCHVVRAGARVIYEPLALSHETTVALSGELERRTRIGAGRAMLVGELARLPRGFALRLLSHKFGRLVLPFLLLGSLAGALSLSRSRIYRRLAALQLAVYGLGAGGAVGLQAPGPLNFFVRGATQFLIGNIATARGVLRAVTGRQSARWKQVR